MSADVAADFARNRRLSRGVARLLLETLGQMLLLPGRVLLAAVMARSRRRAMARLILEEPHHATADPHPPRRA